jgi:hypothetical protein
VSERLAEQPLRFNNVYFQVDIRDCHSTIEQGLDAVRKGASDREPCHGSAAPRAMVMQSVGRLGLAAMLVSF